MPVIGAPRPRLTLARMSGSLKWVVASTIALARGAGSSDLKIPDPTNTDSAPSCMASAGIGGCGQAAGAEQGNLQLAGLGDLLDERQRSLQALGPLEELGLVGLGDLLDVADDRAEMADGLDDVAGAGLALRADHRGTFGDAPECLTQIGRSADERHVERELVDVVCLVCRRQYFGLVDEVDAERLQNLSFDEVADTDLGHHRNRDGGLDALDHLRIAHPGNAAVTTDVGRNPRERVHGCRLCTPRPARRLRGPAAGQSGCASARSRARGLARVALWRTTAATRRWPPLPPPGR